MNKPAIVFAAWRTRPPVLVCHLHGDLYNYGHLLLGMYQALTVVAGSAIRLYLHWPEGSPYRLADGVGWRGVRLLRRSPVRDRLAGVSLRWPGAPVLKAAEAAGRFGRRLADGVPPLAFGDDVTADARRMEAALGIAADRPIVTWHTRTPNFRLGTKGREDPQDDARNNDVEVFRKAIARLQQAGYTVVRLGHGVEPACGIDGVIEYGRSPAQSLSMDLWLVSRSVFMLASDSGPFYLAMLTGTRCLTVGACHLAYYWLRPGDRSLPKRLDDVPAGRALTLSERLSAGLLTARDVVRADPAGTRYRFLELEGADVVAAIEEMLSTAADSPRSPAQQRARDVFAAQGKRLSALERQAGGEFSEVFASWV